MLLFDILEMAVVQFLQDGDEAILAYRLKRFARLFNVTAFMAMLLSCHICCNSDLYITYAGLNVDT